MLCITWTEAPDDLIRTTNKSVADHIRIPAPAVTKSQIRGDPIYWWIYDTMFTNPLLCSIDSQSIASVATYWQTIRSYLIKILALGDKECLDFETPKYGNATLLSIVHDTFTYTEVWFSNVYLPLSTVGWKVDTTIYQKSAKTNQNYFPTCEVQSQLFCPNSR